MQGLIICNPNFNGCCCHGHLEIDALQKLLHGGGLGRTSLPPAAAAALARLLLLIGQYVHVDELEGPHLVVEQAHPRAHGRLADDVNHISFLWEQNSSTL